MLSIVLVSALLSQAIAPVATAKATEGPRFNFLNGNPSDKELLRGLNVTQNQNDWSDPVSGRAGDTFAGIVYYHNGVLSHDGVDNSAKNTRVKVSIPSVTTGKKIFATADLWADGVDKITDTIIDGKVIGPNGLTINLDEDATVEFVPGSVRWFPESAQRGNTAVVLPGGQTGDEILGDRGVNIGAIEGCWNYAGYVTFLLKTEKLPQAEITKSKIAKNLMTSQEGTDISASAGDEILYTLTTKNVGNKATDYVIQDDISDILELADFNEASLGGTVTNGTISYPAVRIVAGETVVRTFKVTAKNPQPTNAQSGKHFDSIMENMYGNLVFVRIGKPGQPSLKIEKLVRNVTISETNFVKANQAKAGDTLEYKITFSNSGEKADNITISDILPINVAYIAGSTILSKGGVNTNPGDGIKSDGISIGSLSRGETATIRFKVKIASGVAQGETLLNTASLWYNKQEIKDTARTVIVEKPVPTTEKLPMTGAETPILSLLFTSAGALYLKLKKAKSTLFLLKK